MGRVAFRLQKSPAAIYRAGLTVGGVPQAEYSSIQAAIDQAVADGHTTSANPAVVEILPGAYTENLALKPGVSLAAIQGGTVTVTGNHTYAVSNGLTRAQNSIAMTNVALTVLNGITLAITGTAPIQLTINGGTIAKQSGGDANPAYEISNTGAGSRVRFNQGASVDMNVTTAPALNLVRGSTEFRDRNSAVFSSSGVTIQAAAVLTNAANLRVWCCDFWASGNFTNIIDIQSASAVVDLMHTVLTNTLAGGNGILFTAAGNARVRWCFVNMNASLTGYIAKGAAGTFIYGSLVIIGANNQVQNTLTILTDNSTVSAVA